MPEESPREDEILAPPVEADEYEAAAAEDGAEAGAQAAAEAQPDEPASEPAAELAEDLGSEAVPWSDLRELAGIIESVVFAAGNPMSVKELGVVIKVAGMPAPSSKQIRAAAALLLDDYALGRRGIVLLEVAAGYQFRTARENADFVRQVFKAKPARLGRAALETLAIVSYRQPVTKADIEAIRGVDADGALNTLLAKRLIKIAGRKEAIGRPLLYATTPEFLETFGLKDLRDLPALDEIAPPVLEEEDHARDAEDDEETVATDDGGIAAGAQAAAAEFDDGHEEAAEFEHDGEKDREEDREEALGDSGEATAEGGRDLRGEAQDAAAVAGRDFDADPDGGEWGAEDASERATDGDADGDGGEAAEDSEPRRDRLAAGGGGDDPRGPDHGERQADDRAGVEGEPELRPDQD